LNNPKAPKSISVLIRQKQSAYDDPLCDGWPKLCDRWRFACVGGNHERSCGGVYVVEMYVSFEIFFTFLNSVIDHGSPYPLPVKGTAKLGKKSRNCGKKARKY
jgi:hypothetical protein